MSGGGFEAEQRRESLLALTFRRQPEMLDSNQWWLCVCVYVTLPEPRDLRRLSKRCVFLWQEPRGAVWSEPGCSDQSEDQGRHRLQAAGVSRVGFGTFLSGLHLSLNLSLPAQVSGLA